MTAQRETSEELGIDAPMEVGEHMRPLIKTLHCVSILGRSHSTRSMCQRHVVSTLYHEVHDNQLAESVGGSLSHVAWWCKTTEVLNCQDHAAMLMPSL